MPVDLDRKTTEILKPRKTPRSTPVHYNLDEDGEREDQSHMSQGPPRGFDARLAVLEDRMPRLEAAMKAGFDDLKETCFIPMIARQDATTRDLSAIKREVEDVVNREKTVRWWAGKALEKAGQLASVMLLFGVWGYNSEWGKALAGPLLKYLFGE